MSTHAGPDPAAAKLPLKLEQCFRHSPNSCAATRESMPVQVSSAPSLHSLPDPILTSSWKSAAGAVCTRWRATRKIQGLKFALKYLQAPVHLNYTRKRQSQVSFYPFTAQLSNQIDCTF